MVVMKVMKGNSECDKFGMLTLNDGDVDFTLTPCPWLVFRLSCRCLISFSFSIQVAYFSTVNNILLIFCDSCDTKLLEENYWLWRNMQCGKRVRMRLSLFQTFFIECSLLQVKSLNVLKCGVKTIFEVIM